MTVHRRIPVTTIDRTLLDLAEILTTRQLERALDEAHHLGLLHQPAVDGTLAAHPNRNGAARLARVLQHHTPGTTRTRSTHEEDFLAFCRRHGLPQPILNAEVEGLIVDALFAEQRVVVEVDPWPQFDAATANQLRQILGVAARDSNAR